MPAVLAFIVIPAPHRVRGKLQRESSGGPTRQAQQEDENTTLTVFLYQQFAAIFLGGMADLLFPNP